MTFNLLTNIQTCSDLIRDTVNVPLIYYSHIPAAIISLFLGALVLLKSRGLLSKILFAMSIAFSVWIICSLITWTSTNSISYMFFWSFFGSLTALISVLCFYFAYVFIYGSDVSYRTKIIWLVLLLPVFVISPTIYNLPTFDAVWCVPNENSYFNYFYYFFGVLSLIGILFIYIRKIKKDTVNKREVTLFVLGIECFLLMFLSTDSVASYLVDNGYATNYNIAPYGLFGMVIFMALLSFIIVRFKAFNIKLIGAQALVWALVILIASEFTFVTTITNQILVSITLVLSAIVGLIIVRSVKKEIAQREELAAANENQQLLIRFITHQVKGFFTKSKMVFASILEGDVGEISEPMKNLVKDGLESDNKAVDMVQEVLRASSLRTGQMTYNFEETDFTGFVKEIADSFKDMAVQKGLKYEVNLPSEKVLVKIDKLQMTQVIKNLIDNSIKYTPAGSTEVGVKIKIDLVPDPKVGKRALFFIKDTGVGLSESDKARLFKEGGRGEESLRVNVNSTGYGLFIVKKIVEGHGGKIWAESAGRGKGSQFYVEIPVVR